MAPSFVLTVDRVVEREPHTHPGGHLIEYLDQLAWVALPMACRLEIMELFRNRSEKQRTP